MLNGLYQCTKNWQGNNEYDIKVRVKETEKSYSMQLVENNSRYSPGHIDMLFSKKDKIMIKKEKSQHSMNVWSDNDFTIYPFRAGIPFHFEKIKTAEEKIALGKKWNKMDNNEHGTNLAEVGTDAISRQQAIDAMAELQGRASSKGELTGISKAWKRIKQLPPIQPVNCSEFPNNSDAISRQAAIDLLKQMRKDGDMIPWEGKDVFARIRKLPPAQSEIIRCRNCKFASGDSRICMKFGHSPIGELDFCAWAERRTDEV